MYLISVSIFILSCFYIFKTLIINIYNTLWRVFKGYYNQDTHFGWRPPLYHLVYLFIDAHLLVHSEPDEGDKLKYTGVTINLLYILHVLLQLWPLEIWSSHTWKHKLTTNKNNLGMSIRSCIKSLDWFALNLTKV